MRRSPPTAQGFTLVELMVVVTIIAVISALVLPSMLQALRERHAQQAAISVLDIARETRSRAMYRGVSQTLVIEAVGTTLRMNSYEGSVSSCRLSTFGGGLFDPTSRVYSLDLSAALYTRDGIAAQVSAPAGVAYLQICYTPLGVAFFSTIPIADGNLPSSIWSNDSTVIGTGGSFVIDVYRTLSGADSGVRRHVVIPLAGTPRMRS